ncbi:MAG: N-acetylneuraminate lyase [Clostridia bacterium]|nr:N-acetylneuraminate lyase [Clostridia bacterium]
MYDRFKGIFPALLTPFNENDEINFDALRMLIERLIAQGVNGFYVDGSTAEAFLLSFEERKKLIEQTAAICAGRTTLIAQVGCISTKQSIELAKTAEACGYDAISSVAPFYYKFTFEEIRKYYFDLADAVSIPVIIYHIPVLSGVSFSVDQMSCFLRDERFAGIKYTSADYFTLRQFKTAFPQKVMLNGFDETFLAGLGMGADGAIGSTYNFMADKFIRILELFRQGRIQEAAELQKEADIIIAALCKVGVMQGEKAILTKMGIPMGPTRAPFIDLTDAQKEELFRAVFRSEWK